MNILIFAGCLDDKLRSKIFPILESKKVQKVFLVRKEKYNYPHPKLVQYNVAGILRKIMPLRELNRIVIALYILITEKIDLILGIHYFMHGIYSYFFSKIFNKKYILWFIENPKNIKPNKLFKKIIKSASVIATRGSNSIEYISSFGVSKERIIAPPNEFVIPNIKPLKEKDFDLIYAGNFIDIKDLPLWVDVIYEVKKDIPNIKGIMVGDGERFEDIKQRIKDKGLAKNITLTGRFSTNKTLEYMNKSKLLLMTSKSEGLPMVAIEAMSMGTPSVLPNVGDIIDLIVNEKNGYIVDSRDPKDFAKYIVQGLTNEKKYLEISKEAKKTIEDMTKESTLEKLVELWSKVLKNTH